MDYQGQRQDIERTVLSNVPTMAQRQGVFTQNIYDPATTASNGAGGFTRTQFPGNTIPVERMDPVARSLLLRYPEPTSAGTANNYRRTASEIDDQNHWDVRLDHQFTSGSDRVFGRLSNFRGHFEPVTPLPEGSGTTTGTLGPQDTTSWAFASSYQHTFSNNLLNELRVGDTRRTVHRTAAQLSSSAGSALNIPGIPSTAQFPNTLPTFTIAGYQILGSPINTASDFNTSVSEVADTLTWVKGRHTIKAGFDWRWERLNVIQPPSPTGSFTFNQLGSDLPGTTNTGAPLASFLLGQVQTFSIDLQNAEIQERASFQEYFVQDDWKVNSRLTITPGLRYTLNFPSTEINGQVGVFNLQTQLLEYPGDEPVRPLKKNNFGPRLGIAYRLTDRSLVSVGYGLIWIEMAGITTPFTTPTFPFLQTVSQRALNNVTPAFVLESGPSVAPIAPTPTAGLGQGVFSVDATLGSGYAQQWNASFQRELTSSMSVEFGYVGSKITHVGIPDTNLNQLTVEQLAIGAPLQQPVPNPFFGIDSPFLVARRSDDHQGAAAQAVPAVHDREPVSQQRRHHDLQRLHGEAGAAALPRAVLSGQLHPITSRRRCLVGVRRVDSHRPGGELPGGRQLRSQPRARCLGRRHPARLRRLGGVGHSVGIGPPASGSWRARGAGQ